jgi:AcrR family transcriptional regulator
VRDAVLEAIAALVAEHGLLSVTMARIAEESGIGRATLYKYFPDVEAILTVWHERQVAAHLEQLVAVRDRAADPARRLEAVLEACAFITTSAPRVVAPNSPRCCTRVSTWPERSCRTADPAPSPSGPRAR